MKKTAHPVYAKVTDSWFSYNGPLIRELLPWLIALLAVLLLGAFFTQRKRVKKNVVKRAAFQGALARRDIPALSGILGGAQAGGISQRRRKAAEGLLHPVSGLVIEAPLSGPLILAPGPDQGLGRGDSWIFRLNDPWVSRGPHTWLRVDNGSVHLVRNGHADNFKVNGDSVSTVSIRPGDKIDLGDSTSLSVSGPLDGSWLGFGVTAGPDFGTRFVLVIREADIGSDPERAVRVQGMPGLAGTILWEGNRPRWCAGDGGCSIGGVDMENCAGGPEKTGVALLDGDELVCEGGKVTVKFVMRDKVA